MKRPLVALAVFLTGGAVMVVELLGVRLISPVFGTGLHVWAALISVALAALALGYFVGGWFADRHPGPRSFFALVVVAGLGVVAIPLYAPALIPAFESAGLRLGALLSATVTFLLPLFLLACASPYAIRISTATVEEVGNRAGRIYAVSTLGSVAGTLATGFLLAPLLEINLTLTLTGFGVALIGLVGLVLLRGRVVAAAALAVGFAVAPSATGPAPDGRLVFRGDTPFQRVEVVELPGEWRLLLDGCVQTRRIEQEDGGSWWGYAETFSLLPGYRPEARSLLVLGLGGGAVIPLLAAEEYRVTAVEIDPVVVDVARRWFGTLRPGDEVHAEDARPFVRRESREWDLVALDVCSSDLMPEHLVTREFFEDLRRVMAPGAVLGMNSICPRGGQAEASMHRTLEQVFEHVEAFALMPEARITNVFFFASDSRLELPWVYEGDVEPLRVRPEGGIVLTDQRNPVNHWNAPWAREIRRTRRERY
ncbi:MAG: fused MFS/spermidine synthase [Planctomycetota bacterium]|jgi:spermidine synthase